MGTFNLGGSDLLMGSADVFDLTEKIREHEKWFLRNHPSARVYPPGGGGTKYLQKKLRELERIKALIEKYNRED